MVERAFKGTSARYANNNDNVNETQNNNDNESYNVNVIQKDSKHIDLIVDNVMRKLCADQDSRLWYCKIAWKLSEASIYKNLEMAQKGHSPQRLFTFLCKKEMQ